jgi:hypothetical protein
MNGEDTSLGIPHCHRLSTTIDALYYVTVLQSVHGSINKDHHMWKMYFLLLLSGHTKMQELLRVLVHGYSF